MNTKSTLEIYERAIPASFEDVDDTVLEVFFALGIVNPLGPTLTYVAAIGAPRQGAPRTVVAVLLNPFSQVVNQVGRLTIGEKFQPDLLDPLYKMTTGDCPTLLLLPAGANEILRHQRARELLSTFDAEAVRRNCSRIEQFFGNPWERVAAAMDGKPLQASTHEGDSILERMSQLSTNAEHLWPEIQALLDAWDGSINQSGIGEAIQRSAFPMEKFKRHLTDRLLPSLWLPELREKPMEPPVAKAPERYFAQTIEELRSNLQREYWDDFSMDRLADLLRQSIILYGLEINMDDIKHISRLYQAALARGMDGETRLLIENEVLRTLTERRISTVAFLPFLVHDPDQQVASKAVIDFVSESGYKDGELYALGELRALFNGGNLANQAAVFGGLVALGDVEVEPLLDEVRSLLTSKEVTAAAKVHTHFLKHRTIQYWLRWCKELVLLKDEESQKKFGGCASAVSLCLRNDTHRVVTDAKRNFPCTGKAEPITRIRSWSIDKYAEFIAPELYELEAIEDAPKLFSDVLRDWGLKPASALPEQYIPETSPQGTPTVLLKDLAPRSPPSFEELLALADSGDVFAQFNVGSRYYQGIGVGQDVASARSWFVKAAVAGHANAQFNLGYMASMGHGAPANDEDAMHWYGLAAKQWHPSAMNNLGMVFERQGRNEEAFYWYLQAAYQGYVSAQASVGFAYSTGQGVSVDSNKAAQFYRLAAANGNAIAQCSLGGLFLAGKGVSKDISSAIYWVNLSAQQGYDIAQLRLGDFYQNGEGIEQSPEIAAQWHMKAALQENSMAQNSMGIRYANGSGVERDPLRAYMWFSVAEKQGSPNAAENLSNLQIDLSSEACKLVRSAIDGNVEAQTALSYKFHVGDGLPKDEGAALYWLRRSAAGGNPWAQTTLSNVLLDSGNPRDVPESNHWLMLAVRQWHSDAIYRLGLRQATGRGWELNLEEASRNFIQASLLGSPEAKSAVATIRSAIPSESWPSIFSRVAWPTLVVYLGPNAPGHLDGIRKSQENDDGTDTAEWLVYEREAAYSMFMSGNDGRSAILAPVFGCPVKILRVAVDRDKVDGTTCAAIKINLFDMRDDTDFPIYWRPENEAMNAVNATLAYLNGRVWSRWNVQFL
jgi:TPR repeat protein